MRSGLSNLLKEQVAVMNRAACHVVGPGVDIIHTQYPFLGPVLFVSMTGPVQYQCTGKDLVVEVAVHIRIAFTPAPGICW